MVVKFLIPAKAAGAIIGKQGLNIKNLREFFKAHITIPDANAPERIVKIQMPDIDSMVEVCKKITELLKDDIQKIRRARFQKNGQKSHDRHDRHDKSYPNDEEITEMKLLVHESQAGAIIGPKGNHVRKVNEKTGAKINVHQEICPKSTEKIVQITGKTNSIALAIGEILKLFEDFPPKGNIFHYDPNHYDPSFDYGGYGYQPGTINPNSTGGSRIALSSAGLVPKFTPNGAAGPHEVINLGVTQNNNYQSNGQGNVTGNAQTYPATTSTQNIHSNTHTSTTQINKNNNNNNAQTLNIIQHITGPVQTGPGSNMAAGSFFPHTSLSPYPQGVLGLAGMNGQPIVGPTSNVGFGVIQPNMIQPNMQNMNIAPIAVQQAAIDPNLSYSSFSHNSNSGYLSTEHPETNTSFSINHASQEGNATSDEAIEHDSFNIDQNQQNQSQNHKPTTTNASKKQENSNSNLIYPSPTPIMTSPNMYPMSGVHPGIPYTSMVQPGMIQPGIPYGGPFFTPPMGPMQPAYFMYNGAVLPQNMGPVNQNTTSNHNTTSSMSKHQNNPNSAISPFTPITCIANNTNSSDVSGNNTPRSERLFVNESSGVH